MIHCEAGPGGRPAWFVDPIEVVTVGSVSGVDAALRSLDAARAAGYWVAGEVAYEASAAFEPRLAELPLPSTPLLRFGVFRGHRAGAAGAPRGRVSLSRPVPRVTQPEHRVAVESVRSRIAAGDCYQVNHTLRCSATLAGDPLDLYRLLSQRHPAGHAAYVDLGGPVTVSSSPELFFAVREGRIVTRPMKGTRPRGRTPAEDAALASDLRDSRKDAAENLMIVDLLRNDLGRVCEPGTVTVTRLFDVEAYPSVWQLTSTVEGDLVGDPGLRTLLAALFPCGSVTGAPKLAAMDVIAALEGRPRGVYCGAIGWMAPNGDADFSVAIRTLVVDSGDVTLGVGGGIVWDSEPDAEWEEALWKSRFTWTAASPD